MLDYHIHTRLCNHAHGAMADYVRQAVSLGLQEICFLDHLTLGERGNHSSMAVNEVGLYYHAAQHIRQRFCERIEVKIGLETDFDPQYAELYREIAQTFNFDVIGCSIHALDAVDVVSGGTDWADGRLETEIIYERYFKCLDDMLDYDYFDMICHFDLVKKFGHVPQKPLDDAIRAIADKLRHKQVVVEINTSGFDHAPAEPYPGFDIIQRLADAGVGLTMGSDAHRPEDIGRHFDRVFAGLQTLGVRELTAFSNRRRYALPLSDGT